MGQHQRTFTGERITGASMKMSHSREAARAMLLLGPLVDDGVDEAKRHCEDTQAKATDLQALGLQLFCCGPCMASVLHLYGIGGGIDTSGPELTHLLRALPQHRDGKGEWPTSSSSRRSRRRMLG